MSREPFRIETHIQDAMATLGGHLCIGRGGYTLYGTWRLSGYDCDVVKATCIAAGLPVIDSRSIPFDQVATLSVLGPMVAVGRAPDAKPWHSFSYAPLGAVAAAYRKAGAEIHNIAEADLADAAGETPPDGSLKPIIDGWHDHVLNSGF
ncbi:MAG: hypothetical protein KGH75_01675 [Rhodospirillales bacterium]|nr:hypothetical protein [Rhodospirillales bacterium]